MAILTPTIAWINFYERKVKRDCYWRALKTGLGQTGAAPGGQGVAAAGDGNVAKVFVPNFTALTSNS
jgi:hypothetical protein